MNIRRYKDSDKEEFLRLHQDFTDFIEELLTPEQLKYEELSENGIKEWIKAELDPKRCVFVVEADKTRLAGFISGDIESDPGSALNNWGVIYAIYVDDQYRGQGLSGELYSALEEWFIKQGCKAARVETWVNNKSAIKAYKAMGFDDFYIGLVKLVT
ncbi:MAG: GNAT family N-acetyltransferase [Actinobacteria bacterium]|nr:MAG: GNAT family N-acetyltransferase [Actinomycetota bacterium]